MKRIFPLTLERSERYITYRGVRMLIPVFLIDDVECQEVPNYLLDRLIAMGRVRSFRRSSGWVVIGRDPIRKPSWEFYNGPERRRRTVRSCIACPDMVNGECISSNCQDRYKKTKFHTFS